MKPKRPKQIFLVVSAVAIMFGCLCLHLVHLRREPRRLLAEPPKTERAAVIVVTETNQVPRSDQRPKIKYRASELTEAEKTRFMLDFEQRYQRAIANWCKAYDGHVPFTSEKVTADRFVERIGKDDSYHEYIFVVDGITLGVSDSRGSARVDYLNDPQQTRKLAKLRDGNEPPSISIPVGANEILSMVEADGGKRFEPKELRLRPTGLSGSLNGGIFANVGGNPNNGASWKYDFVFGPDGKLAYYLKGIDQTTPFRSLGELGEGG
jgi:hypothetical protein